MQGQTGGRPGGAGGGPRADTAGSGAHGRAGALGGRRARGRANRAATTEPTSGLHFQPSVGSNAALVSTPDRANSLLLGPDEAPAARSPDPSPLRRARSSPRVPCHARFPRAFPGVARPTCPGAVGRAGHPPTPPHRPSRRQRGTDRDRPGPAGRRKRGDLPAGERRRRGGGRVPHVCVRACPRPRVPARVPGRARRAGRTESGRLRAQPMVCGRRLGEAPAPANRRAGRPPRRETRDPRVSAGGGAGRGRGGCARGARARACVQVRVGRERSLSGRGARRRGGRAVRTLLGLRAELAARRRRQRRNGARNAWAPAEAGAGRQPSGDRPAGEGTGDGDSPRGPGGRPWGAVFPRLSRDGR